MLPVGAGETVARIVLVHAVEPGPRADGLPLAVDDADFSRIETDVLGAHGADFVSAGVRRHQQADRFHRGRQYRPQVSGRDRRFLPTRPGSKSSRPKSALNGRAGRQCTGSGRVQSPAYPRVSVPHLAGGSTLTTLVRPHGGYPDGRRRGTVNVVGNRSPRHSVPTRWRECLHDVEERFLLTCTIRWSGLEGHHSRRTQSGMGMTKGELAVRNGFSRNGPRGCAPAGAGLSSRIHGRCRIASLTLARVTVNVYLGDD